MFLWRQIVLTCLDIQHTMLRTNQPPYSIIIIKCFCENKRREEKYLQCIYDNIAKNNLFAISHSSKVPISIQWVCDCRSMTLTAKPKHSFIISLVIHRCKWRMHHYSLFSRSSFVSFHFLHFCPSIRWMRLRAPAAQQPKTKMHFINSTDVIAGLFIWIGKLCAQFFLFFLKN